MIFEKNGNWRKFKVENQKKDKGKLREKEIRQMKNHEEGMQGKWILGKREIGRENNLQKYEMEKEKFARVET